MDDNITSYSLDFKIDFTDSTSEHFYCDKDEEPILVCNIDKCIEGYYIIDTADDIVAEVLKSAYSDNLYVTKPIDGSSVDFNDILYKFTDASSYTLTDQKLCNFCVFDWFNDHTDDCINISRLLVSCTKTEPKEQEVVD